MSYNAAEDQKILEYVTASSIQGLVRLCVVRELDPGVCALSVDSVDLSTPAIDMPSTDTRGKWLSSPCKEMVNIK